MAKKKKEKLPKAKSKFAAKVNEKLSVVAGIGNQRHLSLMRDTFATILPLIIVSGFAVIFITVVFGGWASEKTSIFGLISEAQGGMIDVQNSLLNTDSVWHLRDPSSGLGYFMTLGQTLFNNIYYWGIGLLSIFVALAMGYSCARQRKRDENVFYYMVTSLGAFIIATKGQADQWGATSILTALVISLIAVEIFHYLETNEKLTLKLPAGVPPAVARGYSGLIPLAITGLIIGFMQLGSELVFQQLVADGSYTIQDILTITIQQPFLTFAQSGADVGLLFLYVFLGRLFWFFGVHGENTMGGIFGVPLILLWIQNLAGGNYVFTTTTFETMINAPAIGLMIPLGILIFARKNKELASIGRFSVGPAIFTITEPFVFGIPIIFNLRLVIPWMISPMVAVTITVLGIKTGLVKPVIIPVPFTTPIGIGAFLGTGGDWKAAVLALIVSGTTLAIWAPFWKWLSRPEKPQPKTTVAQAKPLVNNVK